MTDKINELLRRVEEFKPKAAAEIEEFRIKVLGKKGELTGVLKMMGKLSAEERPVMGQVANNVRAAIEEKIEQKKEEHYVRTGI